MRLPSVWNDTQRAWLKNRRRVRREEGLCVRCPASDVHPALPGLVVCEQHRINKGLKSYRYWTPIEDHVILFGYYYGATLPKLADVVQRTRKSVGHRITTLLDALPSPALVQLIEHRRRHNRRRFRKVKRAP